MSEDQRFRRVSYALHDGEMCGIAFGDPARAVDIVFIHATGLNARTYARLLQPLGERFHIVALDVRGHGTSRLPPKMLTYQSWNRHRDDIIELMDAHIKGPALFAGHSMGGTTSVLVAGKRPDLVRGLALIDPVILPEARYRMLEMPLGKEMIMSRMPIARGARRRRSHFASREEATAALTGRGFFKTWPADVLADYVADGFVEEGEGVRLSCTPAYEAATFSSQRHDPWRALESYAGPLVMLRAEIGSTTPPSVAEAIRAQRPSARVAVVNGASHALPMERPDRARAAIETALMMAGMNGREAVE